MSMLYASDQEGNLIYIDSAERGLSCHCNCLACGEVVVAKKGRRNKHHFAHYGGKIACTIAPESVLHKLGKQVIIEAKGLQLPPMPGVYPSAENPEEDKTSWWDFVEVYEEQTQQDFRPDLVAELKDGTRLLIEIAVTSFVGEHKQEKIERLQEKTIELDLRYLIGQIGKHRLEIRDHILHDTQHKTWLHPNLPDGGLNLDVDVTGLNIESPPESTGIKTREQGRFTIYGMWVNALSLPSGDLAVRSLAYNPQVAELLKGWAHELSGRYAKRYRSWQYPASNADVVLERLQHLHMDRKYAGGHSA